MKIKAVGARHYVCSGREDANLESHPSPRLPAGARRFWNRVGLYSCDAAVVATEAGKVVGFFRYDIDGKKPWIYAAGTWVSPSYRRRGLALRLWSHALNQNPSLKKVCVTTVTVAGGKLVKLLRSRYPNLNWGRR